MKPKDIFSLAVRLLGLVFLYHGLQALPVAIGQIIGSFPHDLGGGFSQRVSFSGFMMGIAMSGWPLLVAYWLLRGAPFIMRTAYPDAAPNTKDEAQIGGALAHKADA